MLREAGGRVRENMLIRDLAVPNIDPIDGRKVEVVVTSLPLAHGVPAVVDATMVSPLHADGTPWPRTHLTGGHSFARARRHKETTYPELVDSPLVHLVVAGMEVGGRMSQEALQLIDVAAVHRAQSEPRALRRQAARAWRARWLTLLGVAGQDALAATLVQEGHKVLDAVVGTEPSGTDVWLDGDFAENLSSVLVPA